MKNQRKSLTQTVDDLSEAVSSLLYEIGKELDLLFVNKFNRIIVKVYNFLKGKNNE